MSIRTKISLWYAGVLTLIITAFSIAVFGVIQVTIINSIDNELTRSSTDIIESIRIIPLGEFGTLETDVVFRQHDMFYIPGLSVQVWQTHRDTNNITPILLQSSFDLSETTVPLDPSQLSSNEPTFTNIMFNGTPERVITRPFTTVNGEQLGVIQIASSTLILEQVTDGVLTIMISVTILGVLVSIVLGMMVSYRALRPIKEITAAAEQVSTTNDLSTRLPTNVPNDEIGHLTNVFNHMMTRLEYIFGVQQRFVADLSHELRTPLTAIQGNLDMIKRFGADEESIQAIQEETKRMTRMVNEVLMLARADYGDITIDLYPIDLDHVVSDCFKTLPALAQARNRNLKFTIGRHEPVHIKGNYERLVQAVANLAINAIKFTPNSGTITISVYPRDEEHGVLEIRDTGIGIADKDMAHIFDRFYQVDHSRRHFTDEDGAGLGLSIVKWIVDTHNGTIEVDSEKDKGTTFRVVLPLLKESTQSHAVESHTKHIATAQLENH
jgi:signal transduction histidine kinase